MRDEEHLTHAQRRALSENMGHGSERITETHYAKFSDAQRAEVLESITKGNVAPAVSLSDEEKVALVDGVIERLRGR
ncbi:MAG: hypothetical protein WBN04_20485 [Paracoccaceae bacterium]